MIKNSVVVAALFSCAFSFAQEKTLKANAHFPLINGATAVKSADLNNDGLDDLVISTNNNQGVIAYVNVGENKFEFFKTLSTNERVDDVVVEDLDGDGDLDLWLGSSKFVNFDLNELLINDGSGEFTKTVMQLAFNEDVLGSNQLIAADLNNNNKIDILRIQRDSDSNFTGAYIYENDGQANFSEKEVNISIGSHAAISDFDQDGDLDIWSFDGGLKIYANNGQAGFSSEAVVDTNVWVGDYNHVIFEDINQDGLLDLQLFSTTYVLPRIINKGNGAFETGSVVTYFNSPGRQNGVFFDVDLDGDLDLWYTHQNDINSRVIKTAEDGSVDLGGDEIVVNESKILHSTAGDFDNDGDIDVVSVGLNGINGWSHKTSEQFQKIEHENLNVKWGSFRNSVLLDMNNNGNKDLLIAGKSGIKVALSNGRSGFGEFQHWSNESVFRFHAVDFNLDGWGDVSIISESGKVKILYNSKSQGFEEVEVQLIQSDPFASYPPQPYKLMSGDLTGDGKLELVVQEYFGPIHVLTENVTNQNFTLMQMIYGGFRSSQIGDLDSDGIMDLVANNYFPDNELGDSTKGIVVYQKQGNAIQKTASYEANIYTSKLFVNDINNDGKIDILLPKNADGFPYLNLNNGSLLQETIDIPTSGYPLSTADFNGDGVVDFVMDVGQILISKTDGYDYLTLGSIYPEGLGINTFVADIDSDQDLDLIVFEETAGITTLVNTTIDQDFSGLWYNPAQDGHGLQVEEVISNGIPQVNLAWYVYDQGEPMWLTGVGPVDGNSATIKLGITRGANFGSAFNSDDVTLERWGEMTLSFTDKHKLNMSWDGSEYGFSQGEMELDRLAVLKEVSKTTTAIKTCHSGSWFNPSENGHGFFMQVIAGGVDRMSMSWFTYHNGKQYWIIADGEINGDTAVLTAHAATGPSFPPNYDSQDYSPELWGQITFTVVDDDNASVSWQPQAEGFDAGSMELSKLTYIDRYRCQ